MINSFIQYTFVVQNNVFSKIHLPENGSIRAIPENLPFFLDVISKLFQHISGLCDIKYQMT